MDFEPPFQENYKTLLKNKSDKLGDENGDRQQQSQLMLIEHCELPLIDLSHLKIRGSSVARAKCKQDIVEAAGKWGFFQIVNHGVPTETLESMKHEQTKLFRLPFQKKAELSFLNLPSPSSSSPTKSYRWANPQATCLKQLPWSEAFHIPLASISRMKGNENFRVTMETYGMALANLAASIAVILAEGLGVKGTDYFEENCMSSTCFLRMNRYPLCPLASQVFGLMPHTDTDFLTVLCQDKVGGLQLMEGGRWAWSNGVYKSVKHRVMASQEVERFSMAFFYCPFNHTSIESPLKPALYRSFSFEEYTVQVHRDVQATGDKVGLSRFLIQ
ncbi:gibberellin 2-beta-dioxygenase 8-like isoform X2 [Rhodamnia argentea]|uniref:Gibberellin 2-beta-dioxygenase 8-like isoform X2 n=1 Tax=Rhodamnia argentea TaxID=178133 RepID=A0A8B8NN48_9MYRT|nr:gibberellin 2-beta-dioxygenase 8-like isoform X2 [Rhodamnia argentea]